ncbi:MAG: PEGA domain-containing protein [Myxococcaceae bacterium]
MRRAALAMLVAGCAPKSATTILSERELPPVRITTRSELVLTCDPPDAEVVLDGVPQGTCDDFDGDPRALSLKKGARRVQVRKSGFLPWDTVVETDGTRVVMNVTLISAGNSSGASGGGP